MNSYDKNIVSFWTLIDKPMTVRSQGSTSHTRCSWPWWTSTPWSRSGDVSPLDVNNKICSFCLHICATDANCIEHFKGRPNLFITRFSRQPCDVGAKNVGQLPAWHRGIFWVKFLSNNEHCIICWHLALVLREGFFHDFCPKGIVNSRLKQDE